MTRQAIIEPGRRAFFPKSGSWLERAVTQSPSKVVFVSAEGQEDLIIGVIRSAGARRYALRLYEKPIKVSSTAKTEPARYTERHTNKISSAVWDLRRQHKLREGNEEPS